MICSDQWAQKQNRAVTFQTIQITFSGFKDCFYIVLYGENYFGPHRTFLLQFLEWPLIKLVAEERGSALSSSNNTSMLCSHSKLFTMRAKLTPG